MTDRTKQDEIIEAASDPLRVGCDFFLNVLDNVNDPIGKWHAIRAVGVLKEFKAKDRLIRILSEPDIDFDESSLHRISAWSIGQIGSSFANDVLTLLRCTDRHETRLAAIDTLGEIADDRAIPALVKELLSSEREAVLWAALSLSKIGSKAVAALTQALDNADSDLVFIITDALALIGTQETLHALEKANRKDSAAVISYFSRGPFERVVRFSLLIDGSPSQVPEQLQTQVREIVVRRQERYASHS